MFGGEFTERVPVFDRNGRHRRDSIGRLMWQQHRQYKPPPELRPAHQRNARRIDREMLRQDVGIARAADNFGRAESERFGLEMRRAGAQSLMLEAGKIPETERKTWMRENVPDYAHKGGDPKEHRRPTVRQSLRHGYHEVMVRDALRDGHGITDPGERQRDYWHGFAGQVISDVRNPVERRRLGDVVELGMTGRLHPRNVQELANSVDIGRAVEIANGLANRGVIKDPPSRKFRPELRETLRFLLRQPERKVAMSGRVVAVPRDRP